MPKNGLPIAVANSALLHPQRFVGMPGGQINMMTEVASKCPQCHKTIASPARASMTAWLFRAAQCRCENERPQQQRSTKLVEGAADEPSQGQAAPPPMVGSLINDRYELVSLVGQGGMGSVYRAVDRKTQTSFALKMIAPELADRKTIAKRFEYEAEATKSLAHPNIVRVHEVAQAQDGTPFMLMDYIEGQGLDQMLKVQGRLTQNKALDVALQLAEGLEHAHSKGIVHRDLKPSNILLMNSKDGRQTVKIVDFGVAQLSDELTAERTKLTHTGELIGSPLYMSPEQSQGNVLDGRSDVYSFGCVLYEMLSGRPPFAGDNPMQILFKHVSELPPPLPADLHPLLAHVTARCLEKDRADRYQSFADVLKDLRRVDCGKKLIWATPYLNRRIVKRTLRTVVAPLAGIALVSAVLLSGMSRLHQEIEQAHSDSLVQAPLALFESARQEGNKFFDMEDYSAAVQEYNTALLHGQAVGEENQQYQDCLSRLALSLRKLGKVEQAEMIEAQLARVKKFAAPLGTIDSNNKEISRLNLDKHPTAQTQMQLAKLLTNQAALYNLQGNADLALDTAATAVQAAGENEQLRAGALSQLVMGATTNGAYAKADAWLAQLVEIAEKSGPQGALLRAEANLRAGKLHYLEATNGPDEKTRFDPSLPMRALTPSIAAKLATAAAELKVSAATYRAAFAGPSPQEAVAMTHLGVCYMRSGFVEQAQAALEQARAMQLELGGMQSQQLANVLFHMAELNISRVVSRAAAQSEKQALLNQAALYVDQAEKIYSLRAEDTENSILLGETLNLQGLLASQMGDIALAERSYKASIKVAARWRGYCGTAGTAYQRLIALYQSANISEQEKNQKIAEAIKLAQSIESLPRNIKPIDDLDSAIPPTKN
jgi:serine/threonine protein kinase